MMHLRNLRRCEAVTGEQQRLTREFGVAWYRSEDGQEWYEAQKHFSADTLKLAYDENGVIRSLARDVSLLSPAGLSVVEVPDTEENRQAAIDGEWLYRDGKVVRREHTAEERAGQAAAQKALLAAQAESIIATLSRAVRLDMATGEERQQLEAWERYSVLLSRVDTSKPEWPELPQLNHETAQ